MREIIVSIGNADEKYCNDCPFCKVKTEYDVDKGPYLFLLCSLFGPRIKRKQAVGIRLKQCIKAEREENTWKSGCGYEENMQKMRGS